MKLRRASATRRGARAAWLVAAATGLLACAAQPASNRISLRVAPRLSSFAAYLAADAGYFAAEGLDVELLPFDSPSTVIPMLAQGDIDVSTVWRLDPAYINLIARGGRLRLVSAGMIYAPGECGYSAFLARPELLDSGRLDRPGGLRGLRISTERASTSYYVWSRLLRQSGLTTKDVEAVDVPSTARLEAFAKGLVDVATTTEPFRSRLIRSGHARLWRPVAEVLPNYQSSFVVFGRRLLDERRDLGVRFVRAYQRAVREYVEQGRTERLIEIVARRTQIEPQELREMCWPSFSPDGAIDRATIDDFEQWALAEGLIDIALPLESIYDAGFLREAGDGPVSRAPS
jgi:NitT/TauT family transport system substrate-binding protein